MDVMTVLPSKRLETIRGVVSVPGSMGFTPGLSPSRFMDLGGQVELASPDSVVLSNRDQLDPLAFGQHRAPVFVRAMLGAFQNREGKVDHFFGFAGCFGDLADQFVLRDVVRVARDEQCRVQDRKSTRTISLELC